MSQHLQSWVGRVTANEQSFKSSLHYFAYVSTFPWWHHSLLFKMLAISVLSLSTELYYIIYYYYTIFILLYYIYTIFILLLYSIIYCLYYLRTHYHLFESYWVVLLKYQKTVASLPFIFCRRKHIFLMIIHIFTEKHFPPIFEPPTPWTWLTPHFLAFWEIYILITHCWLISIPKTSNGVEWCHMTYFS